MMYRATRTALPALVALAAACATTTRVDRASEEQRIRELSQQASRAIEAKDATRFVSFYADDAVLMHEMDSVLAGGGTARPAWVEGTTSPRGRCSPLRASPSTMLIRRPRALP